MTIKELKPELIWGIFSEITQVPRPSKKEGKMREFLLDFAKKHNIEAKTDAIGNVAMRVPATPGKENAPVVVLQGHMDMVPNQTKPETHNFETDPIQAVVDGEWVHSKDYKTTLGADNGIGVAGALAALVDKDDAHDAKGIGAGVARRQVGHAAVKGVLSAVDHRVGGAKTRRVRYGTIHRAHHHGDGVVVLVVAEEPKAQHHQDVERHDAHGNHVHAHTALLEGGEEARAAGQCRTR